MEEEGRAQSLKQTSNSNLQGRCIRKRHWLRGCGHSRSSLPWRVVPSAHRGEVSRAHINWLCLTLPATHLPGPLCYSSHLLPSALRTEAVVAIGGVPTMALGNGWAVSTFHPLQGTIPFRTGDRASTLPTH